MPRPQLYDRKEIARVLQEEGLEAAEARWPHDWVIRTIIRPMARALGVLPPYNATIRPEKLPTTVWNPEWDAQLGTKPDSTLAQEWGISTSAVNQHRRMLGIPSAENFWVKRRHMWEEKLAAVPTEILTQPLWLVEAKTGIPQMRLSAERKRRGLSGINRVNGRKRKPPIETRQHQLLLRRQIVVLALREVDPTITLEELGEVMGVTRERVRQILIGMEHGHIQNRKEPDDRAGEGRSGGEDPQGAVPQLER